LTTSTVIRTVDVLLNVDCFEEHNQTNEFALELHLRCLVVALKILTVCGSYNCVNYLTFDLLENMYSSLAKWAQYHSLLTQRNPRIESENYNNEFLIVYARDLISSMSWDRDVMIQSATRIAAGVRDAPPIHVPLVQIELTSLEHPKTASRTKISPVLCST
jgi:hypothetical protein